MRSKRGEGERRAERVRERTGWAARPGKQLVGSALVAIRDGRHWRRLVVAVRGGGHWRRLVVVIRFLSALTSFVAVHAVVVCGFRGRWSLFVRCRVIGTLSCRLCVVVSFARCRVVCASLLSLLGGRGSCCRSWTAGILSAGGLHVRLHRGDVVAERTWVVVGRCVEVVGGMVGVVVVVEEDTSQRCDFGITFNMHVKSTNLWDLVWPYFKQVLLETRNPNITHTFLTRKIIRCMLKYDRTHNLVLFCVILNRGRHKS